MHIRTIRYLFTKSSDMLNKNICGVKKCEAIQSKATLQTSRRDHKV